MTLFYCIADGFHGNILERLSTRTRKPSVSIFTGMLFSDVVIHVFKQSNCQLSYFLQRFPSNSDGSIINPIFRLSTTVDTRFKTNKSSFKNAKYFMDAIKYYDEKLGPLPPSEPSAPSSTLTETQNKQQIRRRHHLARKLEFRLCTATSCMRNLLQMEPQKSFWRLKLKSSLLFLDYLPMKWKSLICLGKGASIRFYATSNICQTNIRNSGYLRTI